LLALLYFLEGHHKREEDSFVTVTILSCYAHQDERMAVQLKNHLSLLEHNGRIAIWDYGHISPGTEWEQEVDKHLDEAQIILLLISSSLLATI
jgi:TIR domain